MDLFKNSFLLIILLFLAGCFGKDKLEFQKIYLRTEPELEKVSCRLGNALGLWDAKDIPGEVTIKRSSSQLAIRCNNEEYIGSVVATSSYEYAANIANTDFFRKLDDESGAVYSYDDAIIIPMYRNVKTPAPKVEIKKESKSKWWPF